MNPASHPSSYVTAQSDRLAGGGNATGEGKGTAIVFEGEEEVAVVVGLAEKVLLAAVGPVRFGRQEESGEGKAKAEVDDGDGHGDGDGDGDSEDSQPEDQSNQPHSQPPAPAPAQQPAQIDRTPDLTRLSSLNLSTSPATLLALESKSAALGRYLGSRLADLACPEDF